MKSHLLTEKFLVLERIGVWIMEQGEREPIIRSDGTPVFLPPRIEIKFRGNQRTLNALCYTHKNRAVTLATEEESKENFIKDHEYWKKKKADKEEKYKAHKKAQHGSVLKKCRKKIEGPQPTKTETPPQEEEELRTEDLSPEDSLPWLS